MQLLLKSLRLEMFYYVLCCLPQWFHLCSFSLARLCERRKKTTNMQPKFWLFTSRVLWHCVRLYTEGNPIIGLEYVNQGFYKFQWLDFDGRVNSSVQQCLFGDQFTFSPHLFDIIGYQITSFGFKDLVYTFGGTLVCLDRQRRRIISQSSSGCISPPFNQADDGSRMRFSRGSSPQR